MHCGALFVIWAGLLRGIHGKSVQKQGNSLWEPSDGRTRSEWLRCRGLPCDEWGRTASAMTSLQRQLAFIEEFPNTGTQEELSDHEELSTADVLFTPAQAEQLLQNVKKQRSRMTRAVASDVTLRWKMPIIYKFDGDHVDREKETIREAISQWEKRTCVRFVEVDKSASVRRNHLLFTRELRACASFVGKLELPEGDPQMINLGEHCFGQPGTAVHEIGHALGLWHQHQRPSRDNYVTINRQQIASWAQANFVKGPEEVVTEFDLPYDYNSVMHYSGMVGTKSGAMTISTNDKRFQHNIGQRQELSFLDAKAVNLAYCQDKCTGRKQPHQPCLRGGYQNPNKCSSCMCPDGLTGDFCEEVAPSEGTDCGGEIVITKGESVQVTSPGYGRRTSFYESTECNWLLKGAQGLKVQLEFRESFSLHQSNSRLCQHWIEVKTEKDFSIPGPRLCGPVRPEGLFRSEGSEILITFRALMKSNTRFDGFKLWATAVSSDKIGEIGEMSPLTPEKELGEVQIEWSEWSRCSKQCQCGGCGVRSRHALCAGQRCLGELAQVEHASCSRLCHSGDQELIFVGEFLLRSCSQCCQGFKRDKDICIPVQ
ncbi:hypothetical protein CAPTEDRAFT_224690 [Capitella teleta]|uniref:Metalloendopeptidase n=1 Tax=Capitella teleta TaxID=283909 RepID=R7USC5_CAPTE|nr:hypothetical protein CAPTEDRAFT_224690 [Capitella teleta]|eukprot:ELU09038.1 hypothetical protein CAPTEDRAFT_224690 [Capitella teleta]